ncbi:MAG: hypothetical protein M3490_06660 [Chloroflexota bacterium]|nr:hypothetical protein [Chloroflexota bacterium]
MSGQFEIPPPERLEPRPEFPPITNPPLVDQEPVDWPEPEGFDFVGSDLLDELVSQNDIEGARKIVFCDPRVNDVLGGGSRIGNDPSIIEPKEPDESHLLVFHLYSCDSSNSIEVTFDAGTMDIVGVEMASVQPPLTRDELDTAIDLARQELGLNFGLDLVGRAMGITVDDPSEPLFGRRLADVRIGNPENRLPRHYAMVDLCEGRVLDAGDVR